MRLLLVGAFPYPHFQGSQVYFQEQAIALRAAGADVTLLTYGPAAGRFGREAEEHWRALDGFEHLHAAGGADSSSLRAGPNWTKPMADLSLGMTLRNVLASSGRVDDAYDAILTHNAEAALVALSFGPRGRPPVVYCAHTLLRHELSAYLKGPKKKRFSGSLKLGQGRGAQPGRVAAALTQPLDRIGAALDEWIARRVEGWIALTQSCARVMSSGRRQPGAAVPPPIPDPEATHETLQPEETARAQGLEAGRFFLYTGNLDAYQELDLLAGASSVLARRQATPPVLVIATHRAAGRPAPAAAWAASIPGVEFREVASNREMQELIAAARASLVMRRATGGFPIKLVNSLSLGTPPIAFHAGEWGLTHEANSLIASPERPVESLAAAIERLAVDDVLAKRLAEGARTLFLERHLPEAVAAETLDLIERVRNAHGD